MAPIVIAMLMLAAASINPTEPNNPGLVPADNLECQAAREEVNREGQAYGLPNNATFVWTRCVQIDQDDEPETVSLFTVPNRIQDGPPGALLDPGVARPGFTVPRAVLVLRDDVVHGMGAARVIDLALSGGDLNFAHMEIIVADVTDDRLRELIIPLTRDGLVGVINLAPGATPLTWVKLPGGARGQSRITVQAIERSADNRGPRLRISSPELVDGVTKTRGRLVAAYRYNGSEFITDPEEHPRWEVVAGRGGAR